MHWRLIVMLAFLLASISSAYASEPDFTRDIQPILAKHCTACHGGVKQAGELSFVSSTNVLPPDGWVVEPGKPDESELLRRVESSDPNEQMPPPEEPGHGLSDREKQQLRSWIEAGAKWDRHWSHRPLRNPERPESTSVAAQSSSTSQGDALDGKLSENSHSNSRDADSDASTVAPWGAQSLDVFVLDSLKQNGLRPAEEAPPTQWLRRVSLDLIGLPPTEADLLDFTKRLASEDADHEAIYAAVAEKLLDSDRFGERWAALWMDLARYADSMGFEKDPHRDMWPYRDWVIQALNADMPYDEFTVKQLAGDLLPDATYLDLIATGFHRNTQTNTEGGTDDEEYRTAAVIDRLSTTWTVWQATTFGCVQCHAHPYEPIEHQEFYRCYDFFNQSEDADLDNEFPRVPYLTDVDRQREFVTRRSDVDNARKELDDLGKSAVEDSTWERIVPRRVESSTGVLGIVGDEVRVVGGTVAHGSLYTLEFSELDEFYKSSRAISAIRVDILPISDEPADWPEQGSVLSRIQAEVVAEGSESQSIEFASVVVDERSGPYEPESVFSDSKDGVGGYPKLLKPRWAVFTLKEPLMLTESQTLRLTLHQKASVTGGLSTHLRRFHISFASKGPIAILDSSESFVNAKARYTDARKKLQELKGTQVPVMRDREPTAKRATRQFIRGNWLDRGEPVEAGIPAMLQPTTIGSGESDVNATNRLQFAKWLVSPENPLAARVWVNRIWAQLFGIGIVETQEDFGPSGTLPTHPMLLDHLAYRMQFDLEWSLKSFLREVVLSATYRQDSRTSQEQYESDPRNRLLARGPRNRLSAEMLRDQALQVAGVLDERIGGASVMPPQPEGVWQQVYSGAKWNIAEGPDRYRRALYTYWKRTSPYPAYIMFDAPSRDICSARRIATNTPLQALVTLNSQAFTELAELAAKQAVVENDQPETAIQWLFRRYTTREPTDTEQQVLNELYRNAQMQFAQEESAAAGRFATLEAMSQVALAIMNSDKAMTK